MTFRCKVHNAPFKEGATRWCKRSNPGDTCDPVEVPDPAVRQPPRIPSGAALLLLGQYATEPYFMEFMAEAQEIGFGLDQPGDHDMDDDRWAEVSLIRVSALTASYKRFVENALASLAEE